MSIVYLLHFDRPISDKHTCQHYIGFANNLESRVAFHRKGQSGVRLLEVAHERGIGFVVARVWENGTKEMEKHPLSALTVRRIAVMLHASKG